MERVTIVGIGRLGLGLALLIEKGGYDVLGIDISQPYVDSLNSKTFKTKEPEYENLLQNSRNFRASIDLEEGLNHSDIIFIVVQTPNSGGEKFYDHTILSNLLNKINNFQVENKHIIIGCTVMPKYIQEVGEFLLSDCNNCSLNYNPEFIAQGEIIKGFLYPDIILIGTKSNTVGKRLKEIYQKFTLSLPNYCIISPLEAEITKISINGFVTTKLSFANMLSDVCDNCGADKNNVLKSVGSDSRIGNKYFKPGYSFGGPCFPRDTKALAKFVEQSNIDNSILLETTKYNQFHSQFLTSQLLKENKNEYLMENVCYKENSKIPLIEESAKLKIAKNLVLNGKKVTIKDEIQIINEVKKEYGNLFDYQVV